jgi:hypothetical protein
MKKLFACPWTALCLALLLIVPAVFAQDTQPASPSNISCVSDAGNDVVLSKKPFHLAPAPPEEVARVKTIQPVFSTGRLTNANNPYEQIDIFLLKTDAQKGDIYGAESILAIYVRTVSGGGESWFKLTVDRDEYADWDFMTRTDPDGRGAPDELGGSYREGVSFAVKDRSIPILAAQWFRGYMGANATTEIERSILLDFRESPPSVMAVLQSVDNEGGGACTAPDGSSAPDTSLHCAWDAAEGDFLCESIVSGGFHQTITHRFFLGSGRGVPFQPKPGDPGNLIEFAKRMAGRRNGAADEFEIPGLGLTAFLGGYRADELGETVYLFASPGKHAAADVRFFSVELHRSGASATEEILPAPLVEESSDDDSPGATSVADRPSVIPAKIDTSETFGGLDLSFRIESLVRSRELSAWQILAREGNQHEIVWLAAASRPAKAGSLFSAVRIATESGSYVGCGATRSEAFAASITRRRGALDAILDVEPAHVYSQDGERDDPDDSRTAGAFCPIRVKLTWDPNKGFVLEPNYRSCPDTTKPRGLKIGDDGAISVVTDVSPD